LSGASVAMMKTLWVPGVRKTSASGWPKFVPSIVSAVLPSFAPTGPPEAAGAGDTLTSLCGMDGTWLISLTFLTASMAC
jgi:hypothetical protein